MPVEFTSVSRFVLTRNSHASGSRMGLKEDLSYTKPFRPCLKFVSNDYKVLHHFHAAGQFLNSKYSIRWNKLN